MKKQPANTAGMGCCPPPCGKIRYSSRKVAKAAVARIMGQGATGHRSLRVYLCDGSEYWHATSWPASSMAWKREQARASQDA